MAGFNVPSDQAVAALRDMMSKMQHRMDSLERYTYQREQFAQNAAIAVRPGRLTTSVDVDGTGTAQLFLGPAGEEQAFTTETVADWFGTGGASGDDVLVFRGPYKKGCTYYFVKSGASTKALYIEFTLASALATTDASQASCTVDDYAQGPNPGATVTVYNKAASSNYVFSGSSGAKGQAFYNDRSGRYIITNLECP